MESNDKLYYDKLDLEPFTFSSPNSAGWNDLELKSLLEDVAQSTQQEKEPSKDISPSQSDFLVELFANDSKVFAPIPQKEAIDHKNNSIINNMTLQQSWKQPLPQQNPKMKQSNSTVYAPLLPRDVILKDNCVLKKTSVEQNVKEPKLKQTDSNTLASLSQNETLDETNSIINDTAFQQNENQSKKRYTKVHHYLQLLYHLQNGHIQADTNDHAFSRVHKMINKPSSTTTNNHIKPLQKMEKPKKSLPLSHTNPNSDESLIHLIHLLNKQTLEKLQNRRMN